MTENIVCPDCGNSGNVPDFLNNHTCVPALSDCVNYEMNPLGDCGGRVFLWNDILICETCSNRKPVISADSVPREIHDLYMDGMADEISGNVESPFGHAYRIGAAIVTTDSLGFSHYYEYASENVARLAFHPGVCAYDAWETRQNAI